MACGWEFLRKKTINKAGALEPASEGATFSFSSGPRWFEGPTPARWASPGRAPAPRRRRTPRRQSDGGSPRGLAGRTRRPRWVRRASSSCLQPLGHDAALAALAHDGSESQLPGALPHLPDSAPSRVPLENLRVALPRLREVGQWAAFSTVGIQASPLGLGSTRTVRNPKLKCIKCLPTLPLGFGRSQR